LLIGKFQHDSKRHKPDKITTKRPDINAPFQIKLTIISIIVEEIYDILTLYNRMITKKLSQKYIYVKFNKPFGVLSSFTDVEGRANLSDYINIPDIYAAGRLDFDSEGLMILTNDGKLNHRITAPNFHLPKYYMVQVEGQPDSKSLADLRNGPVIKRNYKTKPCLAEIIEPPDVEERSKPVVLKKESCWLGLTLREGKKRQVRQMTAAIGFPTLRLIRFSIGPINISDLKPGEWKYLTDDEIRQLMIELRLVI
jgi:23S rRNA pseudouridine2457 synthase